MADSDGNTIFESLLLSAERFSFDARKSSVCEADPDEDRRYGMTPEWSPLYGTPTWEAMSEADRIRLTRTEVAHFLGIAIWLELSLQVVLLRLNYTTEPDRPDMRFLLNECADENLHSLMFINAVDRIGARFPRRDRMSTAFGWLFRTMAWEEVGYGIVLAGEEIFDVMQRDWMSTDTVASAVRETSYIHVVEESRHMAFARHKIRTRLAAASPLRRQLGALLIAIGTHVVAKSLVNRRVYESLGLDWRTVRSEIDANEHHRMMFRRSAASLIEFLNKERLLNRGTRWIYRASNLL